MKYQGLLYGRSSLSGGRKKIDALDPPEEASDGLPLEKRSKSSLLLQIFNRIRHTT
jgi:hypothetical protein